MVQIELPSRLGNYLAYVESGILTSLGHAPRFIALIGRASRVAIVADQALSEWANLLKQDLSKLSGKTISLLELPGGEEVKSLARFEQTCGFLAESRIDRSSLLISFGGGSISDLVGFVGSSWMRGVDYISIPTTLLAQVDAAIGGKTGINLSTGKNLIGAIYPPKCVLTDPKLLSSLPANVLRDGFAELIKYGATLSSKLFELLEDYLKHPETQKYYELVCAGIQCKADIVREDEFETKDLRIVLNFGHTVGHALEKVIGFGQISHGQAVAYGMLIEAQIGLQKGFGGNDSYERLAQMIHKFGFSMPPIVNSCEIVSAISLDKKRSGSYIKMTFPTEIGQFAVAKLDLDELTPLLENALTTLT